MQCYNITIILNFIFSVNFQGGEIIQETITSNVSDDLITLEFQRTDGTLITQLIDFRNVSLLFVILQSGVGVIV